MSASDEVRRVPCGFFVVFFLVLNCAAAFAVEDEFKDVREIRTVETYVPYEEFLKIAGKDPNATIMTLEEYRGLVELAAARNGPAKAAPLPPVETSLMEAAYTGRAGVGSSRVDLQACKLEYSIVSPK